MIPWSAFHRTSTLALAGAVLAATVLSGTVESTAPETEVVSSQGEEASLEETAVPLADDVQPEAKSADPEEPGAPEPSEQPEATDGTGGGDPEAPVAELEHTETDPFNMVGVTWASGGNDLQVSVSYRQAGEWSGFEPLEVQADEPLEGERAGTEPKWLDQAADGVAVRIVSASGQLPEDVKVATIDPGEDGLVQPTAAAPGQPPIISRASWGSASVSTSACSAPRVSETRGATIHHTAGSNTYTKAQAAGIVRSTQAYHRGSQGWCDIGYNFLVDKFGRIYEGRVGGITKGVRGAHTGTTEGNRYTMGVSMMGNFDVAQVPTAMKKPIADLVAWRFGQAKVPARGTHVLDGKRVERIIGHRDVKATACPGRYGYAWVIGDLRSAVASRLAGNGGNASGYRWKAPTNLKATASGNNVSLSWGAVSGAKKYVVQVSNSASMTKPSYYAFTTNKGTIKGLSGGTKHIRVTVKHSKTNEMLSPYSAVTKVDAYRWKAPTNLKASGTGSSLSVSWGAVSGAKKYVVRASRSSSMSNSKYFAFSTNKGTIKNLGDGVWYLRVTVKHSKTNEMLSPYSATTSIDAYRWKAPTSVKATGQPAAMSLSWAGQSGAKKYVVKISRNSSMSSPSYRAFTTSKGSVPNIQPSQKYYLQVQIRHSKTNAPLSPYSAVVSTTTKAKGTQKSTVDQKSIGSASSVTFKGHGYGHGIGMSQWGAYGGAQKGAMASKILATYYPGTSLASRSKYIRVHVTADNDGSTAVKAKSGLKFLQGSRSITLPASVSGRKVSHWRIEPYASNKRQSTLRYKSGSTWRTYQSLVWNGQADFAASTMQLVLPGGKTVTYRHKLRAARPSSTSTVRRTVNVLHLNDYTRGVVAREVPASWPNQALRAQAIAARTYGLRSISSGGWYDICDTTSCQVYGGVSAEHSRTNSAVASTSNRVLLYQGSPAFTQFSASSGGYTNKGSQPYLKPVNDPWDNNSANKNHSWSQSVKKSTIQSKYPSIGTLKSVKVTKRNGHGAKGGRVVSLQIIGSKKTVTISGTDARWAFGLKSDWFGF